MKLIGSRAAKLHYRSFREPKDYDFIGTQEELNALFAANNKEFVFLKQKHQNKFKGKVLLEGKSVSFEYELDNLPSSKIILSSPSDITTDFMGFDVEVASPEILTTLKRSHVGFPIHWKKNIEDYSFLKYHVDFDEDLMRMREEEIRNRDMISDNDKSSEDLTNEEFFNRFMVSRKYKHDWLHQITCYGARPLFTEIKPDINKSAVSEVMFNALNHKNKLRLIQEECYALALERRLVPMIEKGQVVTDNDVHNAFMHGLQKISTNLADNPVWIKEFSIENYLDIITTNHDFYKKFLDAIK